MNHLKLCDHFCKGSKHAGSCKILGVPMTFVAHYSCNVEILGLLNATFLPYSGKYWAVSA